MPTPSIPIMPMNPLPALIFEAMTWMGNPSIEVKTTRGDAEERFVMTEAECRKAGECLKEGIRYEIHRVFRYGTPRAGRVIIPAEELFRDYNFRVSDYMVQRRWSA